MNPYVCCVSMYLCILRIYVSMYLCIYVCCVYVSMYLCMLRIYVSMYAAYLWAYVCIYNAMYLGNVMSCCIVLCYAVMSVCHAYIIPLHAHMHSCHGRTDGRTYTICLDGGRLVGKLLVLPKAWPTCMSGYRLVGKP